MWTARLSCQVLRVVTPLGPRYIKPSSKERLYLLWMFRHFQRLSDVALSPRQQKLIDRLVTQGQPAFLPDPRKLKEIPLIGTVEQQEKFHS